MSHKEHSANLWLRKKIEGKVSFVTLYKRKCYFTVRDRGMP